MSDIYKIHLYYGYGKGKTTAAAGLALRALGNGMYVVFCQFLKDGTSGEIIQLQKMDNIEVMYAKENFGFTWTMTAGQKDRAKAAYTQLFLSAAEKAKTAHILVLDEVTDAVAAGLLDKDILFDNINRIRYNTEIVITGHNPPQEFIDISDYVTDFTKIKHPFDNNIPARKGIEY